MARKDYSSYSSINPELTTYGYNSAGSQFLSQQKIIHHLMDIMRLLVK